MSISRIPSLDGLRAASIGLVLLGHIGESKVVGGATIHIGALGDLAHLGVRVFFVISGFLISGLLYGEIAKTGTVSLKGFYLRRTFRIFPAYYFFLAVMAVLSLVHVVDVPLVDTLRAATYTSNFYPTRSWYVGHSWSLAVEEQFYLIWPLAVKLLGGRRSGWLAVLAVVGAPVVRIAWGRFLPTHQDMIGEAFPTVADSIATGCLLAWFKAYGKDSRFYAAYDAVVRTNLPWVLIVVPMLVEVLHGHARLYWLFGETLSNFAIVFIIDRAIRSTSDVPGRILNNSALAWVGTLSYSIYLWQQPFLNRSGTSIVQTFPVSLALGLVCAVASFYVIEKPVLALRQRFEGRKPKGPPPAAPAAPALPVISRPDSIH